MGDRLDHDTDLAGAYVLDALGPEEQRAFEEHLRDCDICQAEVAELRGVVDVLPLAADTVEPPADLRGRILAAATGSEERPPLTAIPGGAPPRKARRFRPVPALLGIVAAAAVVAFGLWNYNLQQQINDQKAAIAYQRDVSQALASGAAVHPVGATASGSQASAALVQPQGNRPAYLIVQGLPQTPSKKVYQLWLMRGAVPRSAAVFHYSGSDPQIVPLPIPATGYPLTAVTIEPGPQGSRGPTGQKVLFGRIG